jgi:hypothetical protein
VTGLGSTGETGSAKSDANASRSPYFHSATGCKLNPVRRLGFLGIMFIACGGSTPTVLSSDGDWSFSDPLASGASLHLAGGRYLSNRFGEGSGPGRPGIPCHETGNYHVVSGTLGFNGTPGDDVVLETDGGACMPSRALFWSVGSPNELWLRSPEEGKFLFVYMRVSL